MKGAIIFSCIVGIGGEHGGNSAGRGQAGEALAVGEAGAPGPAVAVEAHVVVGGAEALWLTLGKVGAGLGAGL